MTEGGTLVVFHRADRVWDQTTFDRTGRLRRPQDGPIRADTVLYLNPDDGSLIGGWGKNTLVT
jgi:peptidylamidoglycolate lyase